ncbi:MAG: CCA tRNA nucleotidyltransferase [Acidobacteria bacterium]|nr:CCA tRNA nucleotidyltransferase [Acidobacteriota bacterium]
MSELREKATEVVQRLVGAGHQAYFVGGCVRDLVLGREPADYDVATDATPDELTRLFPRTLTVGARFGVVLVLLEGQQVEVATFRSDHGSKDGRHPEAVRFAQTAEEDVRRRDFTINGLLYDPLADKILDFVGGQQDLKQGVIRTIGNPRERFAEDKLRMLRAVRFAARFGYRIESETFAALRELAAEVEQVSKERIRDELVKMLTEGQGRRALELLDEAGLLAVVLPEVARMKGVPQPPQFHPEGDVWVHTLLMLEKMEKPTPTLALGVLLHDVGKPPTFRPPAGPNDRIRFDQHAEVGASMAEEICRRLRLSNDEIERVAALVRHHLRFKDAPAMRPSTLKRFLAMEGFEEHLELHRLDCVASHGQLDNYHFVRDVLARLPPEEIRPRRLLSGHDLIRLGYKPGPEMGKMLAAVEEAQLEGILGSTEEALAFVEKKFGASRAEAKKGE